MGYSKTKINFQFEADWAIGASKQTNFRLSYYIKYRYLLSKKFIRHKIVICDSAPTRREKCVSFRYISDCKHYGSRLGFHAGKYPQAPSAFPAAVL